MVNMTPNHAMQPTAGRGLKRMKEEVKATLAVAGGG